MKLAKEKVDLSWLHKPEYEILLPLWEIHRKRYARWMSEEGSYGFRRVCHRDKGRGTTTQYINLIIHQREQKLEIDINNPNTDCHSVAFLPLDNLPPSPRQFQKRVFVEARGDQNTLSASKSNLRLVWREFLETIERMPVVEHHELHIDNSDEGWLE